jgi:ATP-dependent DNA helicase RecG
MTKTELLEIIRNGENSGVEFKRDTIENRELAKELVAFANLNGGMVLLGVEDDGSISGLTRPKLEEWVMTACRAKIRPEIIPFYEVVRELEPGKDVAVVRVDRGWTVHSVWHDQRHYYYIRVGTESRDPSREELERLFQQRGAFRLEVRPVTGSSMEAMDHRRLRDWLERVGNQNIPPGQPSPAWIADAKERARAEEKRLQEAGESSTDWEEIFIEMESQWYAEMQAQWRTLLVNTEMLSNEDKATPATVAGLLLFSQNPNRFLPQAGIDAAAYPGTVKDYAAIERASLRGALVGQFTKASGSVTLVEPGLVEQAVEFVRRNAGVTAALVDGSRREERPAYPAEAVREGIVNALVHRDYLLSATNIELSIYADRLEIISPGRLPNGITPARMLVGCRAARNQLLKDVMRDFGYLEHMGMGVPRKIVKCMQEHNGTTPELIEDGERFTLRLWKEKKP